ncbi:MAG TPA: kelch repeat-containing protein, partial [Chthonomonadaceae bacterium]|nr:kelch repeat-containing protein [Chthonomonadaceae bacterium]
MRNLRTLFPSLILLACLLFAVPARSQSWTTLTHQPSMTNFASSLFLLTNGTVLCQDGDAGDWWKLTPDSSGSYVNGTWTQVASLPSGYTPLYYGSAVLADGRLVIMGGEYNGGSNPVWTNLGAIYDPVANSWTSLSAPSGWSQIGDAESCVLSGGQFLLANPVQNLIASLDPSSLTWTAISSTGKADGYDEEGWTLLPDGTILTVDVGAAPNTERFLPSVPEWISADSTPNSLTTASEMGPAVLRPTGTVFATGANGYTAVYTPPSTLTGTGSWANGPMFPVIGGNQYGIQDGPA